jgi:hypothetical protein
MDFKKEKIEISEFFCEMLTSLQYKCVNKQTRWVPSPKGLQSPKFSDSDYREVRGLGLGRPKSSGIQYLILVKNCIKQIKNLESLNFFFFFWKQLVNMEKMYIAHYCTVVKIPKMIY